MHRYRDEAGISLVETLVTLLLVGIALSAFFQVLIGGLSSLSESRSRQESSQAATLAIEELRSHAPAEIAMYNDPTIADPDEFNPLTISCAGVAGEYDPDGDGPLPCEPIVTNPQGAIKNISPYNGAAALSTSDIQILTIATEVVDAGVPSGTIRVTVVATYLASDGPVEIRRSALFSEVSRG